MEVSIGSYSNENYKKIIPDFEAGSLSLKTHCLYQYHPEINCEKNWLCILFPTFHLLQLIDRDKNYKHLSSNTCSPTEI